MQTALSWFTLGLAAGFLACAANSILLGGRFGYAYLLAGGISAGLPFADARGAAPPRAGPTGGDRGNQTG
jgi:hypothetical protein